MIRTALLTAAAVALTACSTGTPCGDGQITSPEVCDGAVLNGETCVSRGFGQGALKCHASCGKFDMTACGAPVTCNNGVKEGVELCDGADLAGQTCVSQGLGAGTLRCVPNCGGFDVSGCGAASGGQCGNGRIDTGEVCDGAALNNATCQSLGNDYGTLRCLANCTGYEAASCGKRGTKFAEGNKWTIPMTGGTVARSWPDIASASSNLGDFQWATVDMTGDGMPDLISHSRAYQAPPPSSSTIDQPHGFPSDAHWLIFPNTGTGFGTGARWSLPTSGGDVARGWYGLAGTSSDLGDFQWVLLDIDGDKKPDLVSPSRSYQAPPPSSSTINYPHGWPSDVHWLVFLNTGTGFAAGARWTIPTAGGDVDRGWYGIAGAGSDFGDFQWTVLDMTGDGKPDLLSYSKSDQAPPPSTSTINRPHGFPSDSHWLLFPNTGTGFGTAAKWTLPPTGGDVDRGWYSIAGGSADLGDYQWQVTDMTGDGKPDLLSYSRSYQAPPPSSATINYPHGWPSDAHWLMYPNTGTGFGTGGKWTLPTAGGDLERGWYGPNGASSDLGDFQWALLDLDGDRLPDLVSYSRSFQAPPPSSSTINQPHGFPNDSHWLIFPNSGSGFSNGGRWGVPMNGGDVARGWYDLYGASSDLGDFQWVAMDVNGDGRADLCSPSRAYQAPPPSSSTIEYPHGWQNDPHWLVFLNSP